MEVDELGTSYGKSSEKAAAAISTLCREFVETEEEKSGVGKGGGVAEKVRERYEGQQGILYHRGKRDIPENAYGWAARLRSEKINPFVRPVDIVLEYGVGTGWNLAALKCSWKIGYDVSEHLEEAVTSHGIDFITELDDVDDGCADVVLCHHVLEHTANPAEVLGAIGRKLYPAGKLLLYVPFERERRYRRYDREEPNHHLYSWNVQTLSNLVEECGFKVEEAGVGGYGYARFAGVWANKLKLGERGFRFIRRAVGFVKPLLEVRIIARRDFV
jgi:SAM-dependent methyltransferase